METLQSLEFMNLAIWSVLQPSKINILVAGSLEAWRNSFLEPGCSGLPGYCAGSRSQSRASPELPRFHSGGCMARKPWKLGMEGLPWSYEE